VSEGIGVSQVLCTCTCIDISADMSLRIADVSAALLSSDGRVAMVQAEALSKTVKAEGFNRFVAANGQTHIIITLHARMQLESYSEAQGCGING